MISINSRAIHVYFFFPSPRQDSKFEISPIPKAKEGRGSLSVNHTRGSMMDSLRYVSGGKEMDEDPLDSSDPNGIFVRSLFSR